MSKPSRKETEYQNAIEALGLSQMEAAEFFEVGERTSRRYADAKSLPAPLAIALALMVKFNVTPVEASKLIKHTAKELGVPLAIALALMFKFNVTPEKALKIANRD